MQTQEPAGNEGAPAPASEQGGRDAQASVIKISAPGEGAFVTAPAPYLWGGFITVAVVFLFIFALMLRGRAQADARSAAKQQAAKAKGADTEFFQPAGEDAEITFDDEPVKPAPQEAAFSAHEETAQEEGAAPAAEDEPGDMPAPAPAQVEPARRKGPFAGIFAKKKDAPKAEPEEPPQGALSEIEEDEAPPEESANAAAPAPLGAHPLATERKRTTEEALSFLQPASERNREQDLRKAEMEEARQRALDEAETARAEAAEERRLAEVTRRTAEREMEFERRKYAAAFEQREQTLSDRERGLADREASLDAELSALRDDLARELDERFSSLDKSVEARLQTRQSEEGAFSDRAAEAFTALSKEIDERFNALTGHLETRIAALPAISVSGGDDAGGEKMGALADMLGKRGEEDRQEINAALSGLSERIDLIAGAQQDVKTLREEIGVLKRALSERASGPTAPSIQLSDIVRNALPPNAFELRALLPNNRRADCLIKLPHPPGPIAIDARFPVEAFNTLHEAADDDKTRAENEFRRAALRHIVDIAERLIVPEETAESALMFLPSESMYAELHARFPDIVQDSYRARVWIVSPTSLMATLHTIRAVLRDAQARESADLIHAEAQHVLSEVDSLRRRVIALEEDFNRTRHDVRDLLSSTDQVYRRAETISNTRRALSESALDRGSRTIPATPPPAPEPQMQRAAPPPPPAEEEPEPEAEEAPQVWEEKLENGNDEPPPFPLRS